MNKKIINKLTKIAKDATLQDNDEDYIVDDYVGGNVDDAYQLGKDDGEIYLAREILELIKQGD